MTKLLSKEARRLSQMKFKEKEPDKIVYERQTKSRSQYYTNLDRDEIELILSESTFQYLSANYDGEIVVNYSRTETELELQQRISKQQAEWEAYECRKNAFYADIVKRIYEAEDEEKLRRERFNDPDYIELMRLKKKFGEL